MSFVDLESMGPGSRPRAATISLRRERISTQCVCCGGQVIAAAPAILMPFVADRVFGWKPVVIDDSWGLRTVSNGHAYSICKSLHCGNCGHLFCDIRFSESELVALYNKYREEEYTALRDHYEPGYRARNEELNKPINYTDRIEGFLEPHLQFPLTVLDWGGDTGINTPFKGKNIAFDIYDISDREVEAGARVVTFQEVTAAKYRLIVCAMLLEHVPYPSDVLISARQSMDEDSVLYIEVPFEDVMREGHERPEQHKHHWHEHINFYSEESLERLVSNCGLQIVDRRVLMVNVAGADVHIFQVACKRGGEINLRN